MEAEIRPPSRPAILSAGGTCSWPTPHLNTYVLPPMLPIHNPLCQRCHALTGISANSTRESPAGRAGGIHWQHHKGKHVALYWWPTQTWQPPQEFELCTQHHTLRSLETAVRNI